MELLRDVILALCGRFGYPVIRKKRCETGGCIIAFIGADGSGKTTNISSIYKWLSWKLEVKRIYGGSGDNTRNAFIRMANLLCDVRGAGEKRSIRSYEDSDLKISARIKQYLKAKLLLIVAMDKMKSIALARKLRSNGAIILLDRYPQIQFPGISDAPSIRERVRCVDKHNILKKLSQNEEKLYGEMVRQEPDLVIKLVVDPTIALKRKPDHNIEQIKKKVDVINNLEFKKSQVVLIDANREKEEVERDIKWAVWGVI